jgi:hypothetical protein
VFTFKVNDGTADSVPATVTITVSPVNDPPVASNGSIAVPSGKPVNGQLIATDAEGSPLTYSIVSTPKKGTVVLTPSTGAFTYTAGKSKGSDTFTFRANDGSAYSNSAKITVTIR